MDNQYISELIQKLETTEIWLGKEYKADTYNDGIVESIHNLILQQLVDLIMERDGVKL